MKPLDPETHKRMIAAVQSLCREHLDVEIGTLKAQMFLDALTKLIGRTAYNQALADAQAYLQTRLIDMEIDLQEQLEPPTA